MTDHVSVIFTSALKAATDITIGDFTYTPSARRALVRHKLRLILMSRRYFFQFGSREAARRVTQELFDLAFAPGELDVLAEIK